MLSCLLLIRVQRAWFSGAAGWKRCLVCDKSNLGLWFIKCLQNNNRKANGSTQGAPELCRGKKYSECIDRMVAQSSCFAWVLLVHTTLENITENAAFGRELLNVSLSWRGLVCLVCAWGVPMHFRLCFTGKEGCPEGLLSVLFLRSHARESPWPFEISCVCPYV